MTAAVPKLSLFINQGVKRQELHYAYANLAEPLPAEKKTLFNKFSFIGL